MSDPLIQEFEQADKQEKLQLLWKEYGGYIIAAVLLTILFTGLISGWKNYRHNMKQSQTTALINALDQEERAAALKEVAPELSGGIKAVSRLTAAGELLDQDNPAEALEMFELAAQDGGLPERFRDLALLMSVRIGWDIGSEEENEEGASNQDYITRLQPLINKSESPWRAHAHIQAALITASEQNYTDALEYLRAALAIENLPPSLRERARALLHVYSLEQENAAPAEDRKSAAPAEQEAQG